MHESNEVAPGETVFNWSDGTLALKRPCLGQDGLEANSVLIDGLLTNDKFCVVRSSRLTLSWSRAPVHQQRVSLPTPRAPSYPSQQSAPCGGSDVSPVAGAPTDDQLSRRAAALGSRLPTSIAVDGVPCASARWRGVLPATGPTGKPMQAEVPHAHRRVRARFNAQPDAKADH